MNLSRQFARRSLLVLACGLLFLPATSARAQHGPVYDYVQVIADPSHGGTVTGAGLYIRSTTATISATPNAGWTFSSWDDGNTQNPRGVPVVQGGSTYTAFFTKPSSLANISTRVSVGTEDDVLIGGFIIVGSGTKRVIVRAIGPSLTQFQVPNVLANPVLELHGASGVIATNDNWKDTQQGDITGSGVPPSNDLESALIATLSPGAYTAIVRGAGNTMGAALVETYDLDLAGAARLANISTRGLVRTGDEVMIAGLILHGTTSANVVIRGLGPSLASSGVPDALADPTLTIHNQNGTIIATNDNWKDTQQAAVQNSGLAPGNDHESATLQVLAPGSYTAILRGKDGGTGVGLVEVYHLAP